MLLRKPPDWLLGDMSVAGPSLSGTIEGEYGEVDDLCTVFLDRGNADRNRHATASIKKLKEEGELTWHMPAELSF